MASKNNTKIQTPGETSEEQSLAQGKLLTLEGKASGIDEAITANQAIIDDANATPDDKSQAQIKLDALVATRLLINNAINEAKQAIDAINAQAQINAATARKTDLSKINIVEPETRTVQSANVRLTADGYVVDKIIGAK